MRQVKIKRNDTTIITSRRQAAKFLSVTMDGLSSLYCWGKNDQKKLICEHDEAKQILKYQVVDIDYQIGNIDLWESDYVADFEDDIKIVEG